jgi:hypothetical protein
MGALRWILASATAMVAMGFVALLVVADGFRRSFGASENGPFTVVLPVTGMLVFLASLLWPGQRMLLHVAAAMALALAACSVWILRESVFVGVMGLLYSGLWGAWYWHAAWMRAAAPSS